MRPSLLVACLPLLLTACDLVLTADDDDAPSAQASRSDPDERRTAPFMLARTARPPASPQPGANALPAAQQLSGVGIAATKQMQTGGPLPASRLPNPPFESAEIARFDEPWAMTFLPDGRLLVTERKGRLKLLNTGTGQLGEIAGLPAILSGGQGGLGDVVLHPQFGANALVYLSYVEAGENSTRGAAISRARLTLDSAGGNLSGLQPIWRQIPKVTGSGHFGYRMAFDRNGKLWISSGDRQKLDPAQDMQSNLGKILRLNDDGSVPSDNPFANNGGVTAQIWSLGHRNPLGIAFDAQGRLWEHEMGPLHGDELNLIERGANYGWPIVSEGDHYDGTPIPGHDTRPEFNAPKTWWVPTIAPSGFIIYSGSLFPYFRGHGFIGGLASQALIRIEFNGVEAREAGRYAMGRRIREVEQGPDGAIWVLEDGVDARLLKLTPVPF